MKRKKGTVVYVQRADLDEMKLLGGTLVPWNIVDYLATVNTETNTAFVPLKDLSEEVCGFIMTAEWISDVEVLCKMEKEELTVFIGIEEERHRLFNCVCNDIENGVVTDEGMGFFMDYPFVSEETKRELKELLTLKEYTVVERNRLNYVRLAISEMQKYHISMISKFMKVKFEKVNSSDVVAYLGTKVVEAGGSIHKRFKDFCKTFIQ